MKNKPHHIAIFLPSLRGGGAERVMVTLANGFAARGHRVDLVLARAEGPYLAEVAPNVRIVDLDRGRVLASLLPLAQYLRRERPDAMLAALTHANIIAILARILTGVQMQLVVSEHSNPSRSLDGAGKASIIRALIAHFFPRADAVICVSNDAREEMAKMFPKLKRKLHTIYNPLDLERVQGMMNYPVNHPWLKDNKLPVILAAGRLTKAKDYPTLLRAFKLLLERVPAKLIILGQGEEEEVLHKLSCDLDINEQVDFVDFQNNPYAWMRRCDLYVMSSAWEGFGNVLAEALACGAKVVSTDCRAGPREILEDGKWGRLVPVGDAEALAAAMEAALDDTNPPAASNRAADFNPDQIALQYLNTLGVPVA